MGRWPVVGPLRLCSVEPLWLHAWAWRAVCANEEGEQGVVPSGGLEVVVKYNRKSALREAARGNGE